MPQGPLSVLNYALKRTFAQLLAGAAGVAAPLASDPNGNLVISGKGGSASRLGFTGTAVIKAGPGMVTRVNVLVAGSAAGGIFDTASTAGLVTTADSIQQVAAIPNTVGTYELNFPCLVGIVAQAGAGMEISVAYQ